MKKTIFIGLVLILSGCSTPHVVDEAKISDYDLSCESIKKEIDIASRYRHEAQKESDGKELEATSSVIVNGLFLPPLFMLLPISIAYDAANNSNVDEAVNAAVKRQSHLNKIANEKNCIPN